MAEALGLSKKYMKKVQTETKVQTSVPWMFYENPTPRPEPVKAEEESPFLALLEQQEEKSAFEELLLEEKL